MAAVQQVCYRGCVLWDMRNRGLLLCSIFVLSGYSIVQCSSVCSYVFEALYHLIAYCPLSLALYAARTMYVRYYGRVLFVYVLNNGGSYRGLLSCYCLGKCCVCVIYCLPRVVCSYVFERIIANPSFLLPSTACLTLPYP
jgi:hypothetical protein